MLVINFKTYHESTGSNALKLAKIIDKASEKASVQVLIAVQALDLEKVAKALKHVKVIAQHVDAKSYGAHTGHILPEEVKKLGAVGTLINHSEYPLSHEYIGKTLDLAHAIFPEYTIVCSPSSKNTQAIDRDFDPHKIAYEPPELIGGDISVATAKPDIIKKVVAIAPEKQILVGAGIKTVKDIEVSLRLGAVGVLVSSGVVRAADPGKVVKEFLSAWR